jgi:DNA-3-methyladenine glycosylase II
MLNYISHLSKDKKLQKIIAVQPIQQIVTRPHVYLRLCASIISQQLSTKVADVIYSRFLLLYTNKKPTLQQIIDTPFDTLRSIGLSNAKANYVKNVCVFFIHEKITDKKLQAMDDAAIIKYLTQIKGVGQWTVEMILMFTLGRENVFAADDLVIQQSMAKLYHIDMGNKKECKQKMLQIASKWSPYKTYACKYLWGYKDAT